MSKLILLRHGQSEWNKKNIFTGWVDIPLSSEGIAEALNAGKQIQQIPIDLIYTSTLVRGMMTALLAMSVHSSNKIPVLTHPTEEKTAEWERCFDEERSKELIPVVQAWQLNERMYGELQGKNKKKTAEQYGQEQVKLWRRSFSIAPPKGESLQMTAARTLPFFNDEILPRLQEGKNIFVSAHGNSLRSIVMQLDGLSEEEVLHLEIPTGQPLFYTFQDGKLIRDPLP